MHKANNKLQTKTQEKHQDWAETSKYIFFEQRLRAAHHKEKVDTFKMIFVYANTTMQQVVNNAVRTFGLERLKDLVLVQDTQEDCPGWLPKQDLCAFHDLLRQHSDQLAEAARQGEMYKRYLLRNFPQRLSAKEEERAYHDYLSNAEEVDTTYAARPA